MATMADPATGAVQIFVNGDGPLSGSLKVEPRMIEVTSRDATKPDPAWEYTDAAGHWHAWIARPVEMPCNGSCDGTCDGEGYTRIDHHCRICNELIEPAVLPDTDRKWIPGMEEWEVTVHAAVPDGDVSVRVVAGVEVRFGVAVRSDYRYSSETGPTSVLVGSSELGCRRRIGARL